MELRCCRSLYLSLLPPHRRNTSLLLTPPLRRPIKPLLLLSLRSHARLLIASSGSEEGPAFILDRFEDVEEASTSSEDASADEKNSARSEQSEIMNCLDELGLKDEAMPTGVEEATMRLGAATAEAASTEASASTDEPSEAIDVLNELLGDESSEAIDLLNKLMSDEPSKAIDLLNKLLGDEPSKAVDLLNKLLGAEPSEAIGILNKLLGDRDEPNEATEFMKKLNLKLDSKENIAVLIYGAGALLALWLSSAVVGTIDSLPLLPKVMELVGLSFTIWFSSRYLIFKDGRDELITKIQELKEQVIGSSVD